MWNIVKNNIIQYVTDKRKIIVIVVFAFFCGGQIEIADATYMSLCEYMLFVITDHYYVIYFMFMTCLFFSIDSIRQESCLVKIRMKKIKNNYICRVLSTFIQSTLFVMTHVMIAFVVGINTFHCTNYFTSISLNDYYNDTLTFFFEYQKYIKSPISALFIATIFMIIGFTFVSSCVYIVENVIGKKGTIVFMAVVILNIMFGFKAGVHGIMECFFLNHYFLLHHVLFQEGNLYVWLNIVIEVLLLILGYYILRKCNGNRFLKKNDSYIYELQKDVHKYSWIFLGMYVLLNLISAWTIKRELTAIDIGLANLAGYSAGNFSFIEFVKYMLFFLIPIFFVGAMMEKEKHLFHSQVAIRYGNQKIWKNIIKKYINHYILKYVIFFETIVMGFTLLMRYVNKDVSEYELEFAQYLEIKWTDLYVIFGTALFIKIIEVFYYKNIFLLWEDITKNNIAAYIITFSGFGLRQIASAKWMISYGASSMYHLAELFREKGVYGILICILLMLGKMTAIKVVSRLWKEKVR